MINEEALIEELEHNGGVDIADCDSQGHVRTARHRVDQMIETLFPEAAAEIAEAQQEVAEGGILGAIVQDSVNAPGRLRERALDTLVLDVDRNRTRRQASPAAPEEDELQRMWKQPGWYHAHNRAPFTKFRPFRVEEFATPDWEWMNAVGMKEDMPLSDRISLLVCYLNNFWALLGTGRNSAIVTKARATGCHMGRATLSTTKVNEFESWACNYPITFATSERYSNIEKQEILRLFNRGSQRGPVGASSLPDAKRSVRIDAATGEPERTGSKTYEVNAFKVWKFSPLRRSVTDIIFDPTPEEHLTDAQRLVQPTVINIWRPFAYTREMVDDCAYKYEERLDLIKEHIAQCLCRGDMELFDQLIYTFAFWLQRPWVKFESVPILKGEQGVGKGAILEMIMEIVGRDMCYKTTKMDDAVGDKTDNLNGIYILYLNEAYNPQRKEHDSMLKALVTEDSFRFRAFYCPPQQKPKFFRIQMDTNFADVINAEGRDRRYQLYDCDNDVPDSTYFDRLFAAINGEDKAGLRAFADYLYTFDIDAHEAAFKSGRKVIITPLLVAQQMSSMDARKRVFLEILQQGSIHETSRCFDREDEWLKNQRHWTGVKLAEMNKQRCQEELQAMAQADLSETPEFAKIREEKAYWDSEAVASRGWETVVPIDKLVRSYRRLAAETNNRKAMELGLVAAAKEIFGESNVKYYSRSVHLIASEKDKASGVPLKERGPGEQNRSFDLLEDPVQRNYLELPLLIRGRQLFAKFMGWNNARFDPFAKDSADLAGYKAQETYDELFNIPDHLRHKTEPTKYTFGFKRRFGDVEPLNTQAEQELYESPLKRRREEEHSEDSNDEAEMEVSQEFVFTAPVVNAP
jgi:hypothetical protein